jgi:hypothetical protein
LALVAATSAWGQSASSTEREEGRRGVALSDRLVLDGSLLELMPSEGSISNVVSRVVLPALFSHEESMGFSDLEPERLTIVGNSATWTEWRLDDLQLTDPFFEGAAAFKVPFLFISELELLTQESARHPFAGGVRFGIAPDRRPKRRARVTFGVGGLGGTIPGAERLSDFITTAHARSRAIQPEEERRRFLGRLQASVLDTDEVGPLTVRWAAEVDGQIRRHVEFPSAVREQRGLPFDEPGLRASAIAELAPTDRRWRTVLLAEYRQRDHLFAERRFSRAETVGLRSGGVLIGFLSSGFRAGLTFKHDHLQPTVPAFSRELLDLDGEGFFPFLPTGTMNAVRADLGYRIHDIYLASDTRVLAWSGSSTRVHALTFEGAPLGSMTVQSRATATVVGSHRVGYSKLFRWSQFEVAIDGYGVLNHAQAPGTPGLLFPDVGAEAQGVFLFRTWFQPFLSLGKTPISISSQNALAITPGYLTATLRGQERQFVQTFGGDFSGIDRLSSPNIYSVALGFTSQVSEMWKVTFQGIAKVWHGLSRFNLDGPPERFGAFGPNGMYWFGNDPTRYVLQNDPWPETPFGGQVQLEVTRKLDENAFLTAGFSAANFFGHPAFGNGAYGNDIGLLDWQGANPNARLRSFANTDADRAFILKVNGGKRVWRSLWVSAALLYKDGQPLGQWEPIVENGQLGLNPTSNRGSPLQISSPLIGWREDYQIELDVRISYDISLTPQWQLRLGVLVANALDLGNEVSERHWPPHDRSALELQLPRSGMLWLELSETPRS